jgi:iron complex outermembrane recepter protein
MVRIQGNRANWAARHKRGGLFLATVAALPAATATAQDQSGRLLVVEEITVTARRVQENVQDIPLTVNVLTADALESQTIVNFAQVAALVPNMIWDDAGGGSVSSNASMTLRGIASNASYNGFEPGIALYVDDVYVANATAFNRSLLGVERVEVLKGPQGTLFGRNATAGAVALYTKRPATDSSFAEMDFTTGNYDLKQGRVLTNWAISDNVALNVSGIWRRREGYALNLVTDERDVNEEDYAGARAQILWEPSADSTLVLAAEYFEDRGTSEQYACYGFSNAGGPPLCDTVHPTRESTLDRRVFDDNTRTYREMLGASLRGEWRLPNDWELTSITGYSSLEASNDIDQDFTAIDALRSGWAVPDDWQASQELRLSTDQSARLRGVFGAYYLTEEREAVIPMTLNESTARDFLFLIGFPSEALALDHDVLANTFAATDTVSYAIFAQGQYDLTDTVTVELGLRQTWDKKDFRFEQSVDPLAIFPLSFIPGLLPDANVAGTDSDSWDQLTGTVSMQWKPTDSAMLYGRVSRGYKGGGYQNTQFFVADNNDPLHPFDQEILDQIEMGAKLEILDGRVRFNTALFQSYYDDIQIQVTDPITNARHVENAAQAESRGIELEFSAALSASFDLSANLGLQESEFTEIDPGGSQSLLGRSTIYSPETTAGIMAIYHTPVGSGWELVASASANYRSRMFLTSNNTEVSPDVTLVTARFGIASDAGWGVHLWGANLTDETRITAVTAGKLGSTVGSTRLNSPRTYGVELSYKF